MNQVKEVKNWVDPRLRQDYQLPMLCTMQYKDDFQQRLKFHQEQLERLRIDQIEALNEIQEGPVEMIDECLQELYYINRDLTILNN